MPWWLALLNTSLGIISAGFGVVALIRPQTLDPSWDGESGGRFYPAMYAARSVPLGLLVAGGEVLAQVDVERLDDVGGEP